MNKEVRLNRKGPVYDMLPDLFGIDEIVTVKEAADRLHLPTTRVRRWADTQWDTWPDPLKVLGRMPVYWMRHIAQWIEWWEKNHD